MSSPWFGFGEAMTLDRLKSLTNLRKDARGWPRATVQASLGNQSQGWTLIWMRKAGVDMRDGRRGAYDPVSKGGLPQPQQVKDATNRHQAEQWGADVRAEPLAGSEPVLPDGLVRERRGPLNARTGRRKAE